MKEFRWNNFYLKLFSDNSTLYLGLKDSLDNFAFQENIQILKEIFRIYTRENLSTDYISLKLVEDNIPSLLFEITPYRLITNQFLINEPSTDELLSDLTCILLIENILSETKSNISNKKVLRQLASDIFQFWKESILSYSLKDEKLPNNIKEEYDTVIRKFLKKKGKKKIELEYLYEACASGKSHFLSKKDAIEKFGEEIILFGVSEIDSIHFKVLEILSEYIKISFFIPAPRLSLIHHNNSKFHTSKLKELLPERNILSRFLGDKSYTQIEEVLDFRFPKFLDNPEFIDNPKFFFFESQEAYREIEFVGREILSILEENKQSNFRLTSIKLVLPAEDLNYSLLVANIFERMGIPFSFTKDIRKKRSPYFSSVVSLLKLSISDFDKDTIFSLFYNPCFYPILEDSRMNIKPEVWNQIISKMNLTGFLDKHHKKNLGFRESNLMTWESLWVRLNSFLIGDDSEESIVFESEISDEVYQFLEVSTSLLQDLIGLKEDFSSLTEFSNFFKIILDTYLHTSMRYNETDEMKRLNERGQTKVIGLLASIESIESEMESIFEENIKFTLEDFVSIFLDLLESWTEGDARVLKNGVVVGELLDVVDPSFDYIYLVGLDERRFSLRSGKHDSVATEAITNSSRLDLSLKLKSYFYHILNHNAKRYTFSYVSLDTIKDREYYPARELECIRNLLNKDFQKIPLFSYLEYKVPNTSSIKVFEKEIYDLVSLKKKESNLILLKNSYPTWEDTSDLTLSKEVDLLTSEKKLNKKTKSYFFRPSFDRDHSQMMGNKDLSVNKFVSYLECPKKFFYNYSINSEEEQEILGELESVDSLRRHIFIQEVLYYLQENENIDNGSLVNKIFNSKRKEFGEVPFGLLGKIAEIDFLNYIDNYLVPFYKTELLGKYAVKRNIVFKDDLSKTKDSILFSAPELWGKNFKLNVDFILVQGDTLYLTQMTTSSSIKDKKYLTSGFTVFLLEQSSKIKEELRNYFHLDKIELAPAIIHFSKNEKPVLKLGTKVDFDETILKTFWENMEDGKFPASPIETKPTSICDYCPVNTVCYGYQNEYFPFLDSERKEFIKQCKSLYSHEPLKLEKKTVAKSKKK